MSCAVEWMPNVYTFCHPLRVGKPFDASGDSVASRGPGSVSDLHSNLHTNDRSRRPGVGHSIATWLLHGPTNLVPTRPAGDTSGTCWPRWSRMKTRRGRNSK